jgi:hypothetical protein
MKLDKILFLCAFLCFNKIIEAQILVQKIPDENICAIDANLMQSGYQLAFSNMSSEEYLFKGREEEWKKCWIKLMHDLNQFMRQKGLMINPNTKCFNRIYFNKDGTIKAYLYHIEGLTNEQVNFFDESIFQFLISQKITIETNQNYWQYGTLKFE